VEEKFSTSKLGEVYMFRVEEAGKINLSARRRCHFGVFNYFVAFSCLSWFRYKWLPKCKISLEVDISRQ